MTWSIVAHDLYSGAFAVAVTTKALAVGANCPFVRSGMGAVSTQSFTNRYLGPAILDGIARGLPPAAAIEGALAGDEGRHLRQVHAVDRLGRSAAWTGRHCVTWCGGESAPHVSVAGNMLAGGEVVAATLRQFLADSALPLPERLLNGLDAGQAAGGDRRGRQSAALMLTTAEDFPDINLRVDDHGAPLVELRRLLEAWRREVEPRRHLAPSRTNPSGVIDLDRIEAGWVASGSDLRLPR
ncbi:MAG: DUF1028 domain-containing protein [Alphaproteobacteria bacterium]|nr:DUF1028 domain-containing protein [Alphaproteobacteria bacterium]